MNAIVRLLEQRSVGEVAIRVERDGIARLRESGSSKLRMPKGSHEAILINTGGGIAGGDAYRFDISAGPDARLSITSQAAERVYRTLGPAATVDTVLQADAGAELFWLPQETILFDGAALRRNYRVSLGPGARLLAVEPVVLGRTEMGENLGNVYLKDNWRITREGRLVHAENLNFDGALPRSAAGIGLAKAMATIIYLADDATGRLDAVRSVIGPESGASAWNGKLLVRLLAKDGFHLRKLLVPALVAIAGTANLPKVWSL